MFEVVLPENITLELIIAVFGAFGTFWKIIEYFLNRPKISLNIEDSNFREAKDYERTTGTIFYVSVSISNNGSKRTTVKEVLLSPFSKTENIGVLKPVNQTKAGLVNDNRTIDIQSGQTKKEDFSFYTPFHIKKKSIKCKFTLIDSRDKKKTKTIHVTMADR